MPVITDRVVEISHALARHQLAQPLHERIGRRGIDPEIGAGVGKQDREIAFADQDRIELDPKLIGMAQTKRHRCRFAIFGDAADEIGASPAVKNTAKNLQRDCTS